VTFSNDTQRGLQLFFTITCHATIHKLLPYTTPFRSKALTDLE